MRHVVGIVYAMGICFLMSTFLAKLISIASDVSFPALLSAYYVFITPKFGQISNFIFTNIEAASSFYFRRCYTNLNTSISRKTPTFSVFGLSTLPV